MRSLDSGETSFRNEGGDQKSFCQQFTKKKHLQVMISVDGLMNLDVFLYKWQHCAWAKSKPTALLKAILCHL